MTICERVSGLQAVMRYDADRLIEIMANGVGTQVEIDNLIEDYKDKRAELIELEAQFRKEFLR